MLASSVRTTNVLLRPHLSRYFSGSRVWQANRAVVYAQQGDPTQVLSVLTYPALPSPRPHSINIRYILSPINPSDVNVVEGVYPAKTSLRDSLAEGHKLDQPVFVGGNEALAEVMEVGSEVEGLKRGDRVIMATSQFGTWSSARHASVADVIKVPSGITDVFGATLSVSLYCHLYYVLVLIKGQGQSTNSVQYAA